MATIKSYTDLNQSRTLSEFLSHESADQTWERIAIAGDNLDVQDELQYKHNGDIPFSYYSGIGVPCWSLAALLEVLHESLMYTPNQTLDGYCCKNIMHDLETYGSNPVDACYEMILKLHELNLL